MMDEPTRDAKPAETMVPADGNPASASPDGNAPAAPDQAAAGEADAAEKAPEKVTLKPHPLLERRKRRSGQIANVRQAKRNPFMLIIEQHEQGHSRIAKICVAVFAVLVVAVLLQFCLRHLQAKRRHRERVDAIRAELAALDGQIAAAAGYERQQHLLAAVNTCLRANGIDPLQGEHWQKVLLGYQGQLDGKPDPGAHFVVPSAVVDMVNIPRGRFHMGRRAQEPGGHHELDRRLVTMPYEFWLGRTEITNAQFRRFFRQHRTRPEGWEEFRFEYPQQPAALVDWHAANEYCRTVTKFEEGAGRLPQGYEYRLPTEAEWEYACRAGTETYYYWGDTFGDEGAAYANILDEQARRRIGGDKKERGMPQRDGYIVTSPVGAYRPNAFGLHDMSGNVWEWCWDWYNPNAYRELYSTAPVQAEPVEAVIQRRAKWGEMESVKTTSKVVRGGCWGSAPNEARSATRDSAVPETRNSGIGFRLALAPKITIIDSGLLEDQILRAPAPPPGD